MSTWTDWASGVLNGLGAQVTQTNYDSLYAWSSAESGTDLMRWNNPLNSTWYMPGAVAMNTLSNGRHVWAYSTVAEGIQATVLTLQQPGYYSVILAHLFDSVPYSQWGDACADLNRWGTGCGWITRTYGAAPGVATGVTEDLTSAQEALLQTAATYANIACKFIEGEVVDTGSGPVPNVLTQILSAVNALKADVDALKAEVATLSAPSVTVPTQISLTGTLHS